MNSPQSLTEDTRTLQIASDPVGQQLQQIAILTRKSASHLGAALGINQTDMAALEHLITDGPLPTPSLPPRTTCKAPAGRKASRGVLRCSNCR